MGICSSTCRRCIDKEKVIQAEMAFPFTTEFVSAENIVNLNFENFQPTECMICFDTIANEDPRPLNCDINGCRIRCHMSCIYKWNSIYKKCPICDFPWIQPPEIYFPRDDIAENIKTLKRNMANLNLTKSYLV